MQTFLPDSDFACSAHCLDYRRLGKQRVETKQIFLALTQPMYGWKNHPAVKMWSGHESGLIEYGIVICTEWIRRGYNDSMLPWFLEHRSTQSSFPAWIGTEEFHLSHRSNLIRKYPKYYRQFWPEVLDSLPYIWPSKNT